MTEYLPHITVSALLDLVVVLLVVPWVLLTKRDSTAAVAWCLIVILVPLLGAVLFWVFGNNHIERPLRRKQKHRVQFLAQHPPRSRAADRFTAEADGEEPWEEMVRVARRVKAFPVSRGNALVLYHDTSKAYTALLEEIAAAKHHIHLLFFILRGDQTGKQLYDLLTEKARQGVEVRLLYDAMGCVQLKRRLLEPLRRAGGKARTFLPLNPLRSRIQINLRNHRKLAIIDGRIGFTGGMNVGDEYLGKVPYFGYWRDSFLRLEGPAVAGLQRIFAEDWDFAFQEPLDAESYFPPLPAAGEDVVQVVASGPDDEVKTIRELFFAGIVGAREKLWIATPYFVPDRGLLDAVRLACYRGVDVRILTLSKPDHLLPFFAGRFYLGEALDAGARVYRYQRGMMHTKLMLVDGRWALLGSANFDNRSLYLNFEVGCVLHTNARVAELEEQFLRDLSDCVRIKPTIFAQRPYLQRLQDSACRLFAPML